MFSTQSIPHKRFNIPLQSSLKKAFSYFPLSMFSVATFPLKHSLQGIDPSAAKWLMCRRDKLFLQSILLVRWTWAWTPQRSLTQHWTILLEEERNSLAGHRGHQQSLISITTLSWSGNVLRHMVNYSSIDMHVLLWFWCLNPCITLHLFQNISLLLEFSPMLSIAWSGKTVVETTTYRWLHKPLFLVRDSWFLTESQLTLLLRKWPWTSERVRDFLTVI